MDQIVKDALAAIEVSQSCWYSNFDEVKLSLNPKGWDDVTLHHRNYSFFEWRIIKKAARERSRAIEHTRLIEHMQRMEAERAKKPTF